MTSKTQNTDRMNYSSFYLTMFYCTCGIYGFYLGATYGIISFEFFIGLIFPFYILILVSMYLMERYLR